MQKLALALALTWSGHGKLFVLVVEIKAGLKNKVISNVYDFAFFKGFDF